MPKTDGEMAEVLIQLKNLTEQVTALREELKIFKLNFQQSQMLRRG